MLNRLIDRGFLESYKEGKNRFYTPLVAEKEYLAVENKAFLEKVNNHSVTKLVASLYDSHSITEEDLDELAAFIRSKNGRCIKMEKIFQTIWEMSLFAVPVILILAICSNLLGKRYGARWRYLVWLVVAIRLCVPIQLSLRGEWR